MKIEIPTTCPSCESKLERVKDQLFCRNPNCGEKQIKQVINFAKVMKIKGLGEQTVKKLDIRSIPDIYSLTLSTAQAVIGEKLATKLIAEITKSRETSIDKFIAACSIPLVGQTAGRKLANVITYPFEITQDNCKKAGLGDKATSNLMEWLNTTWDTLENIDLSFAEIAQDTKESNVTVCITGKIPGYTKAKLAEYLSEFGVATVSSVSKNIDYLICNDVKNSTKERKATELGIKIVTLENLIKEIN